MNQEPTSDQTTGATATDQDTLQHLFTQLPPLEVEQFYTAYQLWQKQQQIIQIQKQLATLNEKITENARLIQTVQPSPIALVALEQLHARDVFDVDILDRVMAQDDAWLDHTMHLLLRCEQLNLIGGDYTQWCEHALEEAYNWLDSMNESTNKEADSDGNSATNNDETADDIDTADPVTEDQLLLKLMSEEGEEENNDASSIGEQAEQHEEMVEWQAEQHEEVIEGQSEPIESAMLATQEEVPEDQSQTTQNEEPAKEAIPEDHLQPTESTESSIDEESTGEQEQPVANDEEQAIRHKQGRQTQPLPRLDDEDQSITDQWPYVYQPIEIDTTQESSEPPPSIPPDPETSIEHNEQEETVDDQANVLEKPYSDQKQGFLERLLAKILGG